ncbi:energy-coupling factor transporter transmembrane component T [Psychrobacillus sp. FSL K6-2684]|uniref:energy-coupling factor transporter transmembrane component T family protein n=1 Tax=unclassified Psychrobacillus TaxID=2636677 RepID=UPI0012456C3C|nr:energy-coupling factor transporter transmembrane component T [Psychrobacillus sp. AK 1817]QEY21720.1 energy-coupling factor transporter transmembrane protein EcfT [Psychrobacillus sp. AK 1817]
MGNELLSYLDRDSIIHRLTGSTKLICFLLWSTAAMLTYDTRVLMVLLLGSFILFYVSDIKLKDISFVLGFILVFLLLNNIAIFLFAPQHGTTIYGTSHPITGSLGRYSLTQEQLFYQLNITLKYFAVIPPALLFLVTTHPSEFAASLNRIGVSYRLAYSVSIALRYIPDIQRDFKTISRSKQARGVDMSRNERLYTRIKNAGSIIMPLIFSSLERIETVSNTMDLRGFGKFKTRSWFSLKEFRRRDLIAILLSFMLFLLMVLFIFINNGRFYNPFI